MDSFIQLDGQTHRFTKSALSWEGSDWFLALHREGQPPLELAGDADGDRLRIDLRSLDAVLEALQGRPVTSYPGGQSVCAAYLDLAEGPILRSEWQFDWDRALDPPGIRYDEPRRVRVHIVVGG